jgi:hypothetical protein
MAGEQRANASATTGPWRVLGLAACAVLLAFLSLDAARLVRSSAEAFAYRFELDYGEGPIFDQTRRLLAGERIYRAIDEPPYAISNYPPVYHLVSGLFGLVIGDFLAAGRMVSFGSALLTAVLIGLLVWRVASPAAGNTARGVAAAVAGLLFLRAPYTAIWAPLMRVDMLANLFAFAGVVVFAAERARSRRVGVAAALFLLAVFTKQSTVAGAAACLIVSAFLDRRLAARLLLVLAGGGLLILAILSAASSGEFYSHVVTANNNAFSWTQAFAFLQDLAKRRPVELAIAWVATPRLLVRPAAGDPAGWARPVLGAYLIASFLACLTAGKIGSEINYLIEHVAVVATCVGVMVAEAFVPTGERRTVGVAAVAVPALLLAQVATARQRGTVESTEAPPAHTRQAIGRVLTRIEATPGAVLSEDMTLLVRAGKPIVFQPFEMTQLARQGLWNSAPLLKRLAAREFALIVLRFDVDTPPEWKFRRFPDVMLELIRSQYSLAENIDGYWLYVPQREGR